MNVLDLTSASAEISAKRRAPTPREVVTWPAFTGLLLDFSVYWPS